MSKVISVRRNYACPNCYFLINDLEKKFAKFDLCPRCNGPELNDFIAMPNEIKLEDYYADKDGENNET